MKYTDIDGWFSWESICDEFVEKSSDGSVIVELGAWLGKSTAYQACKIKDSNKKIKFYTVDTFKGDPGAACHAPIIAQHGGSIFNAFLSNMESCGCKEFVTPLEQDSESASKLFSDNSVDFIFVDAGHEYSSVTIDLQSWYPKLKPGGIIAGHDATYPPINQALRDFFAEKFKKFNFCCNGNDVWYYQN